jgi:hypothetical protein
MKKVLCLILIAALTFTMVACGIGKDSNEELNPTMTADAFLKALKARDAEAIAEYYAGDPKDFRFTEDIADPNVAELADKLLEKILDFDYVLDNEKIDGDKATVDVHISTYDISGIIGDLTGDIFSLLMSSGSSILNGEDSAAELIKQIVEKIDEAIKTAEKDSSVKVTLKLVKQNDKWLVNDMNQTDDFFRSLFGSLQKWIDGSASFFGA